MALRAVLLWGPALAVSVLCGSAWSVLLSRRLSQQIQFDRGGRSEMDELQLPIADNAFYLSFYYDVARAPTLAAGAGRLLRDHWSEAPDRVNALHKFNVAPELAVAALHRLLGVARSPLSFYVSAVVAVTGLGVAASALTASVLGGGLCGIVSASLYFGVCFSPSLQAGTRLGGASFALREIWGVPALQVQNTWLALALVAGPDEPAGSRLRLLVGYAVCTCLFELCWQFAPFVLFLQQLSLLGAHLLGCLPRWRLGAVAAAACVGTLGALALSFGNRLLLCSPFFALALATAMVGLGPAPKFLSGELGEAAWVLVGAVGTGAAAQQALARSASGREDEHVLQLLLQKLGLAPPEASFDAFLYLQSPEFGFLDMQYVREASAAGVVPAAALASLLVVLTFLHARVLQRRRRRPEKPDAGPPQFAQSAKGAENTFKRRGGHGLAAEKHGRASAATSLDAHADGAHAARLRQLLGAWVAQLLFSVALALLAGLVSRLRVLAAPALCLVAALAASPRLWVKAVCQRRSRTAARLVAYAFGLTLAVVPLWHAGTFQRVLQVGELQADTDMYELVQWANHSVPPNALFMADMTMAAKFRMISPTIRVGNHPQFESLTSRVRNRAYYRTFTCASPARVHQVLSQYNVTHVLLNANACRARMGKLDAFHEETERCGSIPKGTLEERTFCWGGWLFGGLGFFGLEFRNAIYTVLRVNSGAAGAGSGVGTSGNLEKLSTWSPWLAHVDDRAAARGLAHAAARWPKMYGSMEVAQAFQQAAERLAPEDPLVILRRGELQQLAGDGRAAHESMERAASRAGRAAVAAQEAQPEDLLVVFGVWKQALMSQGGRALPALRRLAKSLRPHLEVTANAFDLCDLASWLRELGEGAAARGLWEAAKRANSYDQCVREDWVSWEGRNLTAWDTWRAFLGA